MMTLGCDLSLGYLLAVRRWHGILASVLDSEECRMK